MSLAQRHLPLKPPPETWGRFDLAPTPLTTQRKGPAGPLLWILPPGVMHPAARSEAKRAEREAQQMRSPPQVYTGRIKLRRRTHSSNLYSAPGRRPPASVSELIRNTPVLSQRGIFDAEFAPNIFPLTGRGRFLFDVSKRKWGRIPCGKFADFCLCLWQGTQPSLF